MEHFRLYSFTVCCLSLLAATGCADLTKYSPKITVTQERIKVNPVGGESFVGYTVTGAPRDYPLEALSDAEWVHSFEFLRDGILLFSVDVNPGEERTARITIVSKDRTAQDDVLLIQVPFSGGKPWNGAESAGKM